jgi:hypothetical protein
VANWARDFLARFISDTSKFDTGPVTAGLGDVSQSASDTDRDLSATMRKIQNHTQHGLGEIEHSGKRLVKETGVGLGEEFVSAWGEGIRSGNPLQAISDSLTQLGQIGAGVGGLAGAVGLGAVALGAGVVTSIVQGIGENEQKLWDSIDHLLGGIDERLGKVSATQAITQAVSDLGGGNTAKGLQKIADLSKRTGLSFAQIGKLLAGARDKGTDPLVADLQTMVSEGTKLVTVYKGNTTQISDNAQAAQDLLDLTTKNRDTVAETNQLYGDQKALLDDTTTSFKLLNRQAAMAASHAAVAVGGQAARRDPDFRRRSAAPGGSRG